MVPSLLCTFVAHITFLHVFFLPPPFILSLSLSCFLFLSLSLFFSLSLSLYLCPLFPLLDQSYFFTPYLSIAHIKFTNYSTDYLLRLPSSELLEKHLFRSRANSVARIGRFLAETPNIDQRLQSVLGSGLGITSKTNKKSRDQKIYTDTTNAFPFLASFLSLLSYSDFLICLPFSFSSFLPFFVELFLSLTSSFCFLFLLFFSLHIIA